MNWIGFLTIVATGLLLYALISGIATSYGYGKKNYWPTKITFALAVLLFALAALWGMKP